MTDHVLAGDPSLTSFGAAQITSDQHVYTWVRETDPLPCHLGHRPCPDKHHRDLVEEHARIRSQAEWFWSLVKSTTRLVIIEGPIYGATLGQPDERAGLRWLIVDRLLRSGVPVALINPVTVKAYISGSGSADKEQVRRAVAAAWPGHGLGRVTYDESDAVAIATCAVDWIGWKGPWLEGRRGASLLTSVRWPEREAVRA